MVVTKFIALCIHNDLIPTCSYIDGLIYLRAYAQRYCICIVGRRVVEDIVIIYTIVALYRTSGKKVKWFVKLRENILYERLNYKALALHRGTNWRSICKVIMCHKFIGYCWNNIASFHIWKCSKCLKKESGYSSFNNSINMVHTFTSYYHIQNKCV